MRVHVMIAGTSHDRVLIASSPLADKALQRRRVLADAIPRAGRVADLVLGICDPFLRLEAHLANLVDAHL